MPLQQRRSLPFQARASVEVRSATRRGSCCAVPRLRSVAECRCDVNSETSGLGRSACGALGLRGARPAGRSACGALSLRGARPTRISGPQTPGLSLPVWSTMGVATLARCASAGRPARTVRLFSAGLWSDVRARFARTPGSLPDRGLGRGHQAGSSRRGGGQALAFKPTDEPGIPNNSAARPPYRARQLDVVGDDQDSGGLGAVPLLEQVGDQFVGGGPSGIPNLNAGGHVASDEPVLRRAVEDDRDRDGRRHHGAQPPDQSRRGEWRRRPPEREQHVGAVDDQARDALKDAAIVNHEFGRQSP